MTLPASAIIPVPAGFFTPPVSRHRPCKSYDRSGRRTVGSVYARHLPERHLLIDFAEIVRYLRRNYSEAAARAIVVSYIESYTTNPILFRGRPVRLQFPAWERLGHEAHWYFYLRAMVRSSQPITHAVTINFRDALIQIAHERDHRGPAWLVGQLVNRRLAPLYKGAAELTYGYAIELHRKPDADRPGSRRSWFDSYDSTLLMGIPDDLVAPVEASLADWADRSVEDIRRRHSGSAIHIQSVSEHKSFRKGGDHTLRSGVEGIGDYAAKTFWRLHDVREHYETNGAPFAKRLKRLVHASEDLRSEAREICEGLRRFAASTWHDVAADLRRGTACPASNAIIPMAQPLRIAGGDPVLMSSIVRFRPETGLRSALLDKGLL